MIHALAGLVLSGVTVTLPMESRAHGTELTVGQVAEVSGADADLVADVEALSLGFAPAPGFSRLIWGYQIAERVRAFDPAVEVAVRGQESTRVWPVVETVPATEIARVAEEEIARLVGRRDVEWTMRENLADLRVPATDTAPVVRARPGRGSLEAGLVNVPVEVRVGGEVYRTLWTSWSVEAFQTVPVLIQRVEPGETLRSDMFVNRRVPARLSGARPLPADLVTGSRAVRQLVEGSVVTELDVHRPPAIAVGDGIFLQVTKGAITARVAAQARQSGSIGDRIKVVRLDTGQEFSAVVLSREIVEIELTP